MSEHAAPPLSPEERLLLQRRQAALHDDGMRLSDNDLYVVHDLCRRRPETLTPRQRELLGVLCWRYREQIPEPLRRDLVPAKEPKMSSRPGQPKPATRRRSTR
jgi:hypothetical protein